MTTELEIARKNVAASLRAIATGKNIEFNALDGADIKVVAESKIAYHSRFKSEAHRAAVIAWGEVL